MRILFFLILFSFTGARAADTTRYTIMSADRISGKQLKWSDGEGKVSYSYEYNDRGRGPKLKVDLILDDGWVISRKATGVDYFKSAVDETFEISGGVAKWKNKFEEGQRSVSGHILYSPFEEAPGEIEWDIKLMLRQHTHELETLPAGKVKASHVKSHTARINGFPEELELYSIAGSGGPPSYVWITPKKEYFASISGWSSIIKQGYEFLVPELKRLQDEIEEEYFEVQATKLTHKATTPVAFVNTSVFDSKTGKVLAGQTVLVEQGKISQVGKAKKIKVPDGARIIQGEGKMLLPGLWDNHTHYDITDGLYHLAAGVTNIKDMANALSLPENKKKVDGDQLMGPEISVISGFIDFDGPFAGPTGKIVKTLEEGLAGVNYYADNGYQQVKLYSSIPVEWVKPLAAEAHKRGMKVCGHVPSFMTAERAVNDGYDQIIHMNMIMLNFMGDTIDTRSMGRFTKVGLRAKDIDLNSASVKKFLTLLKDKKIVVDPTLAIFEDMLTSVPGKVSPGYESVQAMMPAEFRRRFTSGESPGKTGHEAEYRLSFDKMLKMTQLLNANKITFVPGTDALGGFTLHRELELYAKAGIPNKDVLRKATYISAQVAGKENELGSSEVGKKAHLILVDGDPVKNISDIRKVETTVKGANIYDCKSLYQAYGFGFWK